MKEQLEQYTPRIIIACGARVGKWFAKKFGVTYKEFDDRKVLLANREVHLLYVPQKQGPHSEPEIASIKGKMMEFMRTLDRAILK
jgi:hypothetical protein